jgi:hypothetical protein
VEGHGYRDRDVDADHAGDDAVGEGLGGIAGLKTFEVRPEVPLSFLPLIQWVISRSEVAVSVGDCGAATVVDMEFLC